MPLAETVVIALGTSAAKYLIKELLPRAWQEQIAIDVLDVGIEWVTTKQPLDPVGEAIGRNTKASYDRSRLPNNEKQAVVYEVARTLATARVDLPRLAAIDLDPAALRRQLLAVRPQADTLLSADGVALYGQMLRVAAESIMLTADQADGFLRVILSQVLVRQTAQSGQLEGIADDIRQMIQGLARWLRAPEARAEEFERKYRHHLAEHLDRTEPFGIPRRDEIGQQLSLQDAFIGLRVRNRSYRPVILALRQVFSQDHSQLDSLHALMAQSLGWEQDDDRLSLLIAALVGAPGDDRPSPAYDGWANTADLDALFFATAGRKQQQLPLFDVVEAWPQTLNKLLRDDSVVRDIEFEETFAGERRIMLESKAGAGKSSLLQWLAVKAALKNFPEKMTDWNGLIPFFIRLRSCREGGFPSPEEWLILEAKPIVGIMPPGWVHEQLESGRALVLIDGIDEMPKKQRPALLRELKSLLHIYPLARYVVSSRPTAVNEKQWPEWRVWLKEAAFSEVTLQEMDDTQLDHFVNRWHRAYAEAVTHSGNHEDREAALRNGGKLKQLLRRREDLRKLARTPLLGAMICTLYQERGENIPRERLKLYEECVQMLLERREQKKEVELKADYISLSEGEKIALLRGFAYWMMDNELTSVESEDAANYLQARLPRLSQAENITGAQVLELFVERSGLLQDEVVGEINFRHRTFQEYLAANAANFDANIRVLANRAPNDQWRETIILAFGLANRKDQKLLLHGILSQARKLKRDAVRRQRLLLALACLETGVDVDPILRREVLDAAAELFPPHSAEEAELIAKAGTMAVDLLRYDPDCPARVAIYSISALAAIGGESALEALAEYAADDSPWIRRAMTDSWDNFDQEEFARRILPLSTEWHFSRLPSHSHRLQYLAHVEKLFLDVDAEGDLSPLADLSQLTCLSLGGSSVVDISPLASLPQLTSLSLDMWGNAVADISPLASLPQLTSLSLWLWGGGVANLRPLASLPQLTSLSLDIGGNTAANISLLASLPQLTSLSLHIGSNAAVDISPLASLPQLTSLSLRGGRAADLSPLAGLPQLTSLSLDMEGNAVVDISPLAGLSQLTSLSLQGNTTVDLSPLAGLSQLTSLSLQGKATVDLNTLAGLSQLTSLSLGSTVADISPLAGLSQLTCLSLWSWRGGVADLSPLAGLSQLTCLSLLGFAAVDLNLLAGLSLLTTLALGLERAGVVDLSPLAGLQRLSSLVVWESLAPRLIAFLRPLPRERGLAVFQVGDNHFFPILDRSVFESFSDKITYLSPKANGMTRAEKAA